MKRKLMLCSVLTVICASGLNASLKVDKVFIPEGFDKNDISQVIVQGHFPDGCYQLDNENVSVDQQRKAITISLNYHHRDGNFCIEMISPFTKPISLGRLPEGDYQVKVVGASQEEKLTIKPASTENTDDYIYAPVEFTEVSSLPGGDLEITMRGRYPLQKRGCMRLVNTIANQSKKDIVVLQPIAELKDDRYCSEHPAQENFIHVIRVPATEKGFALVYVRVLNGGSYSRVFEIK